MLTSRISFEDRVKVSPPPPPRFGPDVISSFSLFLATGHAENIRDASVPDGD